eukprot:CAMPEP_0119418516 /NCGR_PEP_ID=MMETSP1335-20130426/18445_1 /TAXON_ID=259385 /ORGANISM="Chrysoculter rhomboideus, Strain RCC1486" /LENGTH=47 /DNA_ID= /DNA_START= /DNA_END= /DNA_ORIENTATION=
MFAPSGSSFCTTRTDRGVPSESRTVTIPAVLEPSGSAEAATSALRVG